VLPGADLDRIAGKIFLGAFYRSGQLCAAIKRVYVHDADLPRFVSALATAAEAAPVGDPFEPGVRMGPLSNRQQFDRVQSLVSDALSSGARAVTGGSPLPRPGFFFAPTVITDAGPDCAIVAEEQFGPALPVLPYETLEDAIEAANATEFGLGGSVWGDDHGQAAEIATRLEAGSAWVNRHGVVDPEVPFGGIKHSGIGRSNGAVGLDAYCELKTISVAKPRA